MVELFDQEFSFEEGCLLGHAHGNISTGFGGGVAGVEEVTGGKANDGDFSEKSVEEFRGGVFFADGIVNVVIAGVEDLVVGAPDAAPTASADRTEVGAVCISKVVSSGPIDDLLCFDFSEEGRLGIVSEDFDVFFEFEELLFGEADHFPAGVGDGGLTGKSEDFEA